MMKKLHLKFLLLLCALVAGSASAWADVVLTLDCATPAPTGSTSTALDQSTMATFLNSAAGLSSGAITCSAKTGDVYKGKGSGGGDIPQQCLKVGKASGGGSFTFTIPESYDQIVEVEMTCYGWKTTSSISVNSGTAQTFATAQVETTKIFELSSPTKTITINVTTSAVCITEIVLKSSSTWSVSYNANDATGGTVPTDNTAYSSSNNTVTVLGNTGNLAKTGYAFGGWNTLANGQGTTYTAGNTFTISANTTLYAKWNAYEVTAQSNNENYGTVSIDGYVITASPATGCRYATPAYTASNATVEQDGNVFTVTPSDKATVTINFEAIPTYKATFSVNGTTTTQEFAEGASIEFPNDPDDINGMKFVGWYTSTYTNASVAPEFVTSATMGNSNVTYYAVFADVESTTEDITKTYGFETETDDDWTINGPVRNTTNKKTGDYAGRINSNNTYVTFKNKVRVKSFSFEFVRTSENNNYSVYIETNTTTNSSQWNAVKTVSMSSFTVDEWTKVSHTFTNNTDDLYVRFHCYNTTAERYVDDVTITYEVTTTDISNYCTTVSALPRPVITLSPSSIEMTWGDEDKVLTASATLNGSAFNGTITLTPSNANMTIDGSGNIRCNVPGDYTITASIAASESYQAARDVVCNITVGKQDAALSFGEATVQKLLSDGTYTQTATKSAEGVADPTYTISPSGNAINSSTGAVTLTKTGNYTVTATSAANTLYNVASATYTLQVRKAPTFPTFANANVTYGNSYTVDDDDILGGNITVTSSNTAVATVSGLVLTSVAVGTTTVTISTAADNTYIAGSTTFELTVNQPAATTEGKTARYTTTFTNQDLEHGDGELDWTASEDATGYESSGYDRRAQWSNSVSDFTLSATNTESIKKVTVVASTNGDANSIAVRVGTTDFLNGENTSASMNSGDSNRAFEFTGSASGDVVVSFSHSGNNRKSIWVKSITLELSGATVSAKLNSSGYAAFCSEYPLDFSESLANGYSAWQITGIENGTITFERITGAIAGGQGVLLKGTASTTLSIPSVDCTTTLSGNKLRGTLAPTYFADETMYGLSGDKFYLNSPCTLPGNRAYLPANEVNTSRSLVMKFLDDTQGVSTIERVEMEGDAVYDLSGRRVAQPTKGMYIVNGKKVFVK